MNSICKFISENENNMNKINSNYPFFSNDILGVNLASHDSYFIFPMVIFACNFFVLKTANHPWLINYSYNRSNNHKLVYLSFCVSLFSIVWPKVTLFFLIFDICNRRFFIRIYKNKYHNSAIASVGLHIV